MEKSLSLLDKIAIGLIIVPFVAFYTIYSNLFIYNTIHFWNTDLFQTILIMGIGGILSLIYIRYPTPMPIYVLFFVMSVITLGFAPLRDAWLGGIIGNIEIPTYSIMMFISAPMYIKACIHIHTKNPVLLPLGVSIFSLIRVLLLIFSDKIILYNMDYEAMTAYALLIAICASISLHAFKHRPAWVKICIVLGIFANIYTIISLDNRTAILSLFGVSGGFAIWIYALKYTIKNEKYQHVLTAITPILGLLAVTIAIYTYSIYAVDNGNLRTLWERGLFIQQILGAMDWSDVIFGVGWGQSYITVQNNLWVDGLNIGLNNNVISGIGYVHSHNNLVESFLSVGIFGLIGYCAMWIYISWCVRYRPVILSILGGYMVLNSTWYHMTPDMVVIPLMITAIISNNMPTQVLLKNVYAKISEYINMGLAGVMILFFAIIYMPYVMSLKSQTIPKKVFHTTWYNGDATNMPLELNLWRYYIAEMEGKFRNDESIPQWRITRLVDIIDTLKHQSNQGNRLATKELLHAYEAIFMSSANHPILEQLRMREYNQWASAVLRANDHFNNRPEFFKPYFSWHVARDFHTAVWEVSKRLRAKDPNNAVALYWRAVSLENQGEMEAADILFKEAFSNNITRYHAVKDVYYEKYKYLLDPRYK